MLLLKMCWSKKLVDHRLYETERSAWAPKRFPSCFCICSEYGSRVAFEHGSRKKRGRGHRSPRPEIRAPFSGRYRAAKVTNLPVQTRSGSRQAGSRRFRNSPGCIAAKRSSRGLRGLQASELGELMRFGLVLKLSADNHLKRHETTRFHVEHFCGTHGTFCGTIKTNPEMDSVALNLTDGSVLPFKRAGHFDAPLRAAGLDRIASCHFRREALRSSDLALRLKRREAMSARLSSNPCERSDRESSFCALSESHLRGWRCS
jgi:hypothetical protein